jgi:hypothetical protein
LFVARNPTAHRAPTIPLTTHPRTALAVVTPTAPRLSSRDDDAQRAEERHM